jgi:DNA invertase Pin-like site-specific DNA recombinase
MADAKQRRFDVVAVWKIDRFGRSLRHLLNALDDFESLGFAFVSLKDSLDLTSASGRLLFQLVAAMAEFERALIQERVRAGIRNARNKGRRLGRPRARGGPWQVARLRANGASLWAISEQLGISVGSVHRAVQCSKNL